MSHEIRILTETQLREAVRLDKAAVDATERAFIALAGGEVVMPPALALSLEAPGAFLDVRAARVPGLDSVTVRIAAATVTGAATGAVPGHTGAQAGGGVVLALCARTGRSRAVMLDNGHLHRLAAATAGAVAARHLAPSRVRTAGVIGTGVQARMQMQAAFLERPFAELLVWGRDAEHAAACAADLKAALGVRAGVVSDPARLVAQSQLVVTTTAARAPILQADWLHPGLHITAVGSDEAGKNEIDPGVFARADLYVADRASETEERGELRSAIAAGVWDSGIPAELGEVITGAAPGRRSDDEITLCDLTGTSAQETALAVHALSVIAETGTVIAA